MFNSVILHETMRKQQTKKNHNEFTLHTLTRKLIWCLDPRFISHKFLLKLENEFQFWAVIISIYEVYSFSIWSAWTQFGNLWFCFENFHLFLIIEQMGSVDWWYYVKNCDWRRRFSIEINEFDKSTKHFFTKI